jgi:hypothetical protein
MRIHADPGPQPCSIVQYSILGSTKKIYLNFPYSLNWQAWIGRGFSGYFNRPVLSALAWVVLIGIMYRRPTLYPLEIAVDFLKSL